MSTRSMIGMEREDGTVVAVYCHFDGYLDGGVGSRLLEHYADREKVAALVALGNLSTLDEYVAPPDGVEHSYGRQYPGVTVAYHRDRGEDLAQSTYAGNAEYFAAAGDSGDEYRYLFAYNGPVAWLVKQGRSGGVLPLADALKIERAVGPLPEEMAGHILDLTRDCGAGLRCAVEIAEALSRYAEAAR